jgi:hypothetical protein
METSSEPIGGIARDPARYIDERTVEVDSRAIDIVEAAAALPWIRQLCPFMPHEYVVLSQSPLAAFSAIEAMVRLSPASYRGYFRAYSRPLRYWDGPDGNRYWMTGWGRGRMVNRAAHAQDPPRRVDQGARPEVHSDGPPWAPPGSDVYAQAPNGKWWPTKEAIENGFRPCRACQRGNPWLKTPPGPSAAT